MVPSKIHLHSAEAVLEVHFPATPEDEVYRLGCEYLRVFSPSAEVQGHGEGRKLVGGKAKVKIQGIDPVGNYAVRLVFDDGHDTGLYTWKLLRELGQNQQAQWAEYVQQLQAAGLSREPTSVNVSTTDSAVQMAGGGCPSKQPK